MLQEYAGNEELPICCSKNCSNNIPTEDRKDFCKKYDLCKTYESQWMFLISNVDEVPLSSTFKKKVYRYYRIGSMPVCQKSFCGILGISSDKVKRALEKFHKGCLKNNQGGSHRKTPEDTKDLIVNYINTFPPYLTHYRWKKSEPKFTKSELTMGTMYRLFSKSWRANCSEEVKPPSLPTYKKIFDSLGLDIREFKSDKCQTCNDLKEQMEDADDETRKTLEEELDEHFDEATELQEQITFDFEPIEKKHNPRENLRTVFKPGTIFTCDICSLEVEGKLVIKKHIQKHFRENNFRQSHRQLRLKQKQEARHRCDECGITLANEATWSEHVRQHFLKKPLPSFYPRFRRDFSKSDATKTLVSRLVVQRVFLKKASSSPDPRFEMKIAKTDSIKVVAPPPERRLLIKTLSPLLPRCNEVIPKPVDSRKVVPPLPSIVRFCEGCGGETLNEATQARAAKSWPCYLCAKVFRLGSQFWKHNSKCHADV